jgi:hypothetical protein
MDKTVELLQQLIDKVDALTEQKAPVGRSPQINELASALAKAQAEMKVASLEAENPYFKNRYADLAAIIRASRPALTKHGLAVSQQILVHEDGQSVMHSILMHSSGQWIETCMRIVPAKNDLQTLGSCLTYLRRYGYAALVGVTASDEDDDGEVAMTPIRQKAEQGTALNLKYDPRNEPADLISKDQIAELEYELAAYPDIAEMVLEGLRLQSLADMPKSKYRASLERIRSIKNARDGKQ